MKLDGAEQSAADRAARQRLQQHRDREREHAHPQDIREYIGRDTGLPADHQRVDDENRDDADVLDRGDDHHQRRRHFLDPVDEIGGFSR